MKKILTPFFFCFSLILLFPSCQPFLRGTAPHGRHPQQGGGNGGAGGSGGSNESGPANDKVGLNFQGDVITDLQYATNAVDYKGNKESLALDLYMPDKLKTGRKYPLYIFVHGGGFLRGDKRSGADFCKGLATKGFVAASINYRLGWSDAHTISNLCAGDSIELKKAGYRAVQDAKAAIRFLTSTPNEYEIDPNWIFIGGQSAGGATALNATYLTEQAANIDLPGITTALGPLDSYGNNLPNKYKIKGMVNNWGAMHSTALITKTLAVPTIFFHGEKDQIAPVDQGYAYTCPNFLWVYGSIPVYNILKSLGVSAVIHLDPQGGHGVFSNSFRLDNITCFFQNVMVGKHDEGYYVGEKNNCK